MKVITYQDLMSWEPCYDPVKYIPVTFKGTILDLLVNAEIPLVDLWWAISQEELIPEPLLRRFLAWCAAESLFLSKQTDARCWDCVEASVRFSYSAISDVERSVAESAAWSAAESARSAAESARSAARSVAESAAWSAAESAARLARLAVRSVAWSAAESAARSASSALAARSAARLARSAQRAKLISMLRSESDFTPSDLLNNYPIERG